MNRRISTLIPPMLVFIFPVLNTPLFDDPSWAARMPLVVIVCLAGLPLLVLAVVRRTGASVLLAGAFLGWAALFDRPLEQSADVTDGSLRLGHRAPIRGRPGVRLAHRIARSTPRAGG